MTKDCRHILPNGRNCHAPAMRGKAYCYHHMLDKRAPARGHACTSKKKNPAEDPLVLPEILDQAAIRSAVSSTLLALAAGRIERRRASTLLYGLQLAQKHVSSASAASNQELCDLPLDSSGDIDLCRLSPQALGALDALVEKIVAEPDDAPPPPDKPN